MKNKSVYYTLLEIFFVLLLAGCAAGPDFKRPARPDVTRYTESPLSQKEKSAPRSLDGRQHLISGAPVDARWWRTFHSPKLDGLIEQAFKINPTIDAARAVFRQAQELYAARAGSTLYPQVTADLGAQRQRMNPGVFGQTGDSREFALYTASVGVHYNLDLAGGNRRALEALAAKVDYQRFELKAARLNLAGSIATTAITQAWLGAQINVTQAMLHAQEEQLSLVRKRLKFGQVSQDEVLSLQIQVERTRAGLTQLRNQWRQTKHLLAVLAGHSPAIGGLPVFHLQDFTLPPNLPLVIPSELVRHRPDIQAAEALLHAANANYGAAAARLYPQLNLSADLGSQALTAGSLFAGGSGIWTLAGQLTQPLFDRGLPAEKRAAFAEFNAADAQYRAVVLESFRNVADVLRSLENDSERMAALSAAAAASKKMLDSTQSKYSLGAASYYDLLIARQQYQQTQFDLAEARGRRLINSVDFYQAMGGGIK